MEEWISSLLERPLEDLDREYEDHENAYNKADSLGLAMVKRGESTVTLSEEIFYSLHRRLYGHPCEDPLWSAILCNIGRPLPVSIAHDLLDREMAGGSIGYSRQTDEVQWRMAMLYDAALLTLAGEFYTLEERTFTEFQDLLHRFPNHARMLMHLSLASASSPEKETYLFHHIRQLPAADAILEPYNQKVQERQARQTADSQEINLLFQTREPHILCSLAQNPHTPPELLQAMTLIKNVPFARPIRNYAKQTLKSQRPK